MIITDLPWIILSVVLGIIALVTVSLILVFAVRVKLTMEINETFSLWVSFMGVKRRLFPAKPKKYKLRDYTPKKIARRDAIAAKKAAARAEARRKRKAKKEKEKALKNKMTRAEKRALRQKNRASRPEIPDIINLFIDVSETLFSTFFGHFHFHVARIRIKVGSSDAAKTALLCTAIGMALEPVLVFIDYNTNLHGMKRAEIDISPDYLSEKIEYDVKLAFSMSLGAFIWVILRAGIPGIVGWVGIQPPSPDKTEIKPAAGQSQGQNSSERPQATGIKNDKQ